MRPFVYLRKLVHIPPGKILLLCEAVFWLAMARLALWLVPFPRIGRYLGKLQPPSPVPPTGEAAEMLLARRVGWAVNLVADRLPVELVCLPRALAGWQMLHRRHLASRLHFGALRERRSDISGLQTHAWLSAPGVEVTGYPVAYECVELGYFARSSVDVRGAASASVATH